MKHFSEFYYTSSTGNHKIYALKCEPTGLIRGIIQIAHGISEHIDRYRDFMAFMADQGFVCVGNDHLGHGKTILNPEEKGVFAPKDGWNHVVRDMVLLRDLMAEEYADLPYIMFGHSMGSFLLRTYMADYPAKYDMAIISGTGHQSKAIVTGGNMIADMIIRKNGYGSDGTRLQTLAMGGYLKKIADPRTPYDWLSRDEKQVDRYAADPLCGFVARSGIYADMLKGIRYVTDMQVIAKVPVEKPVLFISGSEDPVGDYGKGVVKAFDCFRKAGVQDVDIRLYEGGRHEMLNEINRSEVFEDILEWIESRI